MTVVVLFVVCAIVVVIKDAIMAACAVFLGMAYFIWLCFLCCSVFFFDAVQFGC